MPTTVTNENIDIEVESPLTRERLHAIQGITTLIDMEQLKGREELEQRRGMAKAAAYIAKRITQERIPLREAVETGKITSEESAIRKGQIDAIAEVVAQIAADNAEDVKKLKGVVEGLARAGTACESRFNLEVATYQRHTAEPESEVNEAGEKVDDLGRTSENRAAMAAPLGGKVPSKRRKAPKKKRTRKG